MTKEIAFRHNSLFLPSLNRHLQAFQIKRLNRFNDYIVEHALLEQHIIRKINLFKELTSFILEQEKALTKDFKIVEINENEQSINNCSTQHKPKLKDLFTYEK